MINILQLIGAVIALIIASIFTFIFPGAGGEIVVIGIAGSIFSYFGYEWRVTYDEVKSWVQSKSLWGVAIVLVPSLVLLAASIFSWDLCMLSVPVISVPLCDAILWLIRIGGGVFVIGAIHAKVKKTPKNYA